MQRISQKVYETDKGLWNTIKKWFENLVARLKKLFADLDPQSENGRIVREMGDRLDSVRQMWADMVIEAGTITTEATQEQVKNSRKDLEKLDADYLSAVERGDMEAAQKMVDEAAKEAGYDKLFYHGAKNGGGFTKFRDWSYFTENKQYAERYTNREKNESLYTTYVKMQKPFDTRKNADKKLFYEIRQEYGLSEIQNSGLPDWTDGYDISDYIDENNLDYDGIVLDEGGDLVDGKPISRGLSYVVRKSAQIKSADPVTYDDKGKVIPLSQRFNAENDDIRYSRKPFAEQVDDVLNGMDTNSTHLKIMETPKLLQEAGLPNLPILMTAKHLKTITQEKGKDRANYHGLGVDIIKNLPKYINDPVMIADSLTRDDSVVIITEALDKEKRPVIAAIMLNGKGTLDSEYIDANIMTSAYGRNNFQNFINSIANNSAVIYWNKNKSQELSVNLGLQLPNIITRLDSDTIIRKAKAFVNTNLKNSENFQEEMVHSRKTVDPITSREQLAKALSRVAKGEDRAIVESYKANVNLIKGETARLESLRKEIDEIKYKKSITYEGRELSVKEFEQIAYTRAEETGIEAERVKFKEQSLYKKDHDKKS